MNLDAIGLVRLPDWASTLRTLYWHLRMARPVSRPCPRTWRRRITSERHRLVQDVGIDPLEVHLVCRILVVRRDNPAGQWRAERAYVSYMLTKQKGGGLLSFGKSRCAPASPRPAAKPKRYVQTAQLDPVGPA